MKRKLIKVTACALAGALLLQGQGIVALANGMNSEYTENDVISEEELSDDFKDTEEITSSEEELLDIDSEIDTEIVDENTDDELIDSSSEEVEEINEEPDDIQDKANITSSDLVIKDGVVTGLTATGANKTKIVVPDGVVKIGDYAFWSSDIESISFPDSLEEIGDFAFGSCHYIEKIVLPSGLKAVGEQAFYSCFGLTEIKFECSDETEFSSYIFGNTCGIQKVEFPENWKKIPEGLFKTAGFLSEGETVIELPEGIEEIGASAFENSYASRAVIIIPPTVNVIGKKAFSGFSGSFRVVKNSYAHKWLLNNGFTRISFINGINGITYNLNGGQNNPQNVYYFKSGDTVVIYDPVREGYTFGGWFYDSKFTKALETNTFSADQNTGNIVLYAKWIANSYGVEYELNGGTNNEKNPEYFVNGSKITLLSPTKTGYIFKGWYNSAENANNAGSEGKVTSLLNVSNDITLYAAWEPITYTIKFDKNGGAGNTMAAYLAKYDQEINLEGYKNTYTKVGCEFIGWATSKTISDTSEIILTDESTALVNLTNKNKGTVTLYAQWKAITYEIHYENMDGVDEFLGAESYIYGEKVKLLNPTKYGYKFLGWYSDSAFTKKVTSINTKLLGGISLYANWKQNEYSVILNNNLPKNETVKDFIEITSYDVKGGNGERVAQVTSQYTVSQKYEFIGWNTKKDGKGIQIGDNGLIDNLTEGTSIVLYAQWQAVGATIQYEGISADDINKNPSIAGILKDTTLVSPIKTGYVFKGWYADEACTIQVKKILKADAEKNYNDKTTIVLYSKFDPISYTVKYNPNGGKGTSIPAAAYLYDTSNNLALNTYTKLGYKFVGWNTKKDGKGISFQEEENVENLMQKKGTITLYAIWEAVPYDVSYVSVVDGTLSESFGMYNSNPVTNDISKAVKLIAPVAEGYTFGGWYSNPECTKKYASIPKGKADNQIIYAKWTANVYTITYSGNGGTPVNYVDAKTYKTGEQVVIMSDEDMKLSREGYDFVCWSISMNGSFEDYQKGEESKYKYYEAGSENVFKALKNIANLRLYAIWEQK